MSHNTAVKHRAYVGGSILDARASIDISHAKFQRKTLKRRSLKFVKGNKSREKRSLRLLEYKAYSITYCGDLPFTKKVIRFSDTVPYWLLYLWKIAWLWRPESTPPSHYNVNTCADVWALWLVSLASDAVHQYL